MNKSLMKRIFSLFLAFTLVFGMSQNGMITAKEVFADSIEGTSILFDSIKKEIPAGNKQVTGINSLNKMTFSFKGGTGGIKSIENADIDPSCDYAYTINLTDDVSSDASIHIGFESTEGIEKKPDYVQDYDLSNEKIFISDSMEAFDEAVTGYRYDLEVRPDYQGDGKPLYKQLVDEVSGYKNKIYNKRSKGIDVSLEEGIATVQINVVLRKTGLRKYLINEGYYRIKLLFMKQSAALAVLDDGTLEDSCCWADNSDLQSVNSEKKAVIVTPYQQSTAVWETKAPKDVSVELNGNVMRPAEDGQTYTLNMKSAVGGAKNTIKLSRDGSLKNTYLITCYQSEYSDMPDKVVDYICPASQYTNGNAGADDAYGTDRRAFLTLRGGMRDASKDFSDLPPVSLGNFGGYITYYYEDAIKDDEKNPYGIDFIVYGNSVDGTEEFHEPGNVLVSADGETWYTLAGSVHYDDIATWNQTVKYSNNNGKAAMSLGTPMSRLTKYSYPTKDNYKLFKWDDKLERIMEFSGTMLPEESSNSYGNHLPVYPAFGYADCGIRSTSNEAQNPYGGIKKAEHNGFTSGRTDGFDLAWAVNDQGEPATLPEEGIHYVKIQTATCIDNGKIGEKSTEVNMVRRAAAAGSPVGKTKEPTGILVDGKPLELELGQYRYEASADGVFDVEVKASDDANVYINSARGKKASFKKAAHGIVRIIIQEGKKEPVIYYIKINQSGEPESAMSVLLDAQGGYIGDEQQSVWYFDDNSGETVLPTPNPRQGKIFDGWYDDKTEGTKYTSCGDALKELAQKSDGKATLYARWSSPEGDEPEDKSPITVSFSVIGDTAHGDNGEVHTRSGGNLTPWISETSYEVESGSTAWDVIKKADETDNDLLITNPGGNYITKIQYKGTELGEFTNGKYSGWMYTINGVIASYGVAQQKVKKGDRIGLFYTDDYRKDWDMETAGLTAEDVTKLIEALPAADKLTLKDISAVAEANRTYAALSPEAQAEISKELQDKLDSAVKRIVELSEIAVDGFDEKTSEKPAARTPAVKKGTKVSAGGEKYVVTRVSGKKQVSFTGSVNRSKKNIVIPSYVTIKGKKYAVTAIKKNALKGNKAVCSVAIGKNIVSVGASAFAGCRSLTKVTLGKKVTKIGRKAFSGDKKLRRLVIKSTKIKKVGAKALKGVHREAVVKVPRKKYKAYKRLFKGKGQPRTVKIKK